MPKSIRQSRHLVRNREGDALEGDIIMVECRKAPKKWDLVQGSGAHKGSQAILRKDAYAVISQKFTNMP